MTVQVHRPDLGPVDLGAWRARLPGLLVTSMATAGAFALSRVVGGLNASTLAVALGALAVNTGLVRERLRAGLAFATRTLLRAAVGLLGLQLSLADLRRVGGAGLVVVAATVAVTFFGTRLIGHLLGVRRPLALLVATGFSICGASAVAGMAPVADGDEDDTIVAVALVTLCGSLAIVVLPLLRVPLGLDYAQFGSWTGASVHDVGQTVATANRVGHGALEPAIVVKLTRVLLLAPLVAGVALHRRVAAPKVVPPTGRAQTRPPIVAGFVLAFGAAVVLRSSGLVPAAGLRFAQDGQQVLLVAALFGLGTGVSWTLLRRAGGRPLMLGSASWVLVAAVSYAGVRFLG